MFIQKMSTNQTLSLFYEEQDSVIRKYLISTLILPILTIPIYIEGIYCLYFSTDQLQQHYTSVLKNHVFLNFIGEIFGFYLMRPVVILPVVGLNSEGLLGYFNFHTFFQLILVFLLYQVNACTMIHLLIIRLKSVLPITFQYYKLSIRFGHLFVYGTYISSVCSLSNFALLYENQDNAKFFWYKLLAGNMPARFWSESYVVASGSYFRFSLFLKLCSISLFLYIIACIFIPVVAFQILNRMKHRLSRHVVQAQKMSIKALLFQISIIVSFLLFPFSTFIVGLEMRVNNPLVVAISLTFAMVHGAAATLAMIIANKPHRTIFLSHLKYGVSIITCSINSKDEKACRSLSTISNHFVVSL
ncbi:Serpentine Receptor, class H [Caenorhabditis elegans]|uniref:Serpentine Receptor, class H n=1 Tax=Caenorhabditis elegans TaxID=6239 RepID=Q23284_CAEEL|nr:Serpentine Receptor, class H [Caenorhabditis elegans]CCD72492.1 Serpentine Receptor, class H [Caenorhabditis elegans]|eukprot:NP_504715.2 Serpentine Receptor, class H [Caenorhabditis elegans]